MNPSLSVYLSLYSSFAVTPLPGPDQRLGIEGHERVAVASDQSCLSTRGGSKKNATAEVGQEMAAGKRPQQLCSNGQINGGTQFVGSWLVAAGLECAHPEPTRSWFAVLSTASHRHTEGAIQFARRAPPPMLCREAFTSVLRWPGLNEFTDLIRRSSFVRRQGNRPRRRWWRPSTLR